MFYYVKNLQGDIVKILDEDGQEKANYVYNAWGDILSQSEDELSSTLYLSQRAHGVEDSQYSYAYVGKYRRPHIRDT